MIILQQSFTKEQRSTLGLDIESFFFLQHKKPNAFKPILNLLKSTYNLSSSYDIELWTFISAVGKALKHDKTSTYFTLNSNHYTLANKGRKSKISAKRMSYLLHTLAEDDFIDLYKGFRNIATLESAPTIITFGVKLLDVFPVPLAKKYGMKREITHLVYIKDSKTGEAKPTQGVIGVKKIIDDLIKFNNHSSKHKYSYKGLPIEVYCYRVFHDNLKGSGRVYMTSTAQTMKSGLRKHILIDGEETCEIDIKNTHPSMIAEKEGYYLDEDFDAYKIPVPSYVVATKEDFRNVCKVCVLIMLYTNNKIGALSEIRKKIKETTKDHPSFCKDADVVALSRYILSELSNHNPYLKNYLFKGDMWKDLQNLDASVNIHVLMECVKADIPVMAYHDSWVFRKKDSLKITEYVNVAWHTLLGNNENLRLEFK